MAFAATPVYNLKPSPSSNNNQFVNTDTMSQSGCLMYTYEATSCSK